MSLTIGDRSKRLNGNGAWAQYCNRKRERNDYTYRIDCTGGYYLINGERIEESEFNQLFPIGLIDRSTHTRLDCRQNLF